MAESEEELKILLIKVKEENDLGIWENGTETYILSCKKRITSLCLIQDSWGWCTGMIQRDDMGWEVGAGFRIGNSCTPVTDSCQCMAKRIQYC